MRKDGKYTIDGAIAALKLKHDVKIDRSSMTIDILSNDVVTEKGIVPNPLKKGDLGIRSLGKIDYLVNHCNFKKYFVKSFN